MFLVENSYQSYWAVTLHDFGTLNIVNCMLDSNVEGTIVFFNVCF